MIIGFRHKGLKLYCEKGNNSRLAAQQTAKIRLILTRLEASTIPEQINAPGYKFHSLSGDLKRFYSVRVTENYRITFRFEGENVTDVDYTDYH